MASNGNGGKPPQILGVDGRPASTKPRGIAVLKIPQSANPPTQQGMEAMMQITGCNLIILPMEYELVRGKIALNTLESMHTAIHEILKASGEEV